MQPIVNDFNSDEEKELQGDDERKLYIKAKTKKE